MPRTFLACFAWVAVSLLAIGTPSIGEEIQIILGPGGLVPGEREAQPAAKANDSGDDEPPLVYTGVVDVRFGDGSTIKLKLKQDSYNLVTPYGKLAIPAKEVRLIELAPRVSEEIAKQIEEAVANLGSLQFEIREKATAELLKIGPQGYPLLIRMARSKDLEVAARLDEIIDRVQANLPEEQVEPRQWDIVHTLHSRIAGKLEGHSVPAESKQFGEVELKFSDVRDLHFQGGFEEVDLAKLEVAPANMYDKANQIGKTFVFKVTGALGGSVYGTDTYTLDSSLATAAVHAGVVKEGKTGVLRVKIVESPEAFVSSTRNGITSSPWGRYPAAYKIIKR